ncbi:MAG: hypothetical protein GTN65_01985 [Armatimonadetes bacterium]|nr:hypothetical protein [Armatimonadota bacterium]NIO95877.1 hypothetical protein [Armatimonadota bacterium]
MKNGQLGPFGAEWQKEARLYRITRGGYFAAVGWMTADELRESAEAFLQALKERMEQEIESTFVRRDYD